MGLMDKANNLADSVQQGVKTGSTSILTYTLKIISAVVLGLTMGLIGEAAFGFQTISFVFVFVVVGLLFFRIAKSWKLGSVLIFDLICLLIGIILRMYILIAPN